MENKRIVIIDGSSLFYRAYYAIQRPMMTQDGLYTQAIYGFVSMLQKIRNDYEPTHMLVAWDHKGPTFRHEEYEEYKADRPKMPPELAMQLQPLKQVLDAMRIRMYEQEGYEADDIIGTIARMADEASLEAYVITGDKDALQLAGGKTTVIITQRGISQFAAYDESSLAEELGFSYRNYVDYMGLRGDPSDNIPGIPGVGEKTAVKLVKEFGSIENLLKNLEGIQSPKLRERISEHAQVALMSKQLATIFTQVPLPFTLEDCRLDSPDISALVALYEQLEFRTHLQTLMQQQAVEEGDDAPDASVQIKLPSIRRLSVEEDIAAWFDSLPENTEVTVSIDSNNLHTEPPSIDAMEWLIEDECVILCDVPDLASLLAAHLSKKILQLTGHHLQQLYYALAMNGIEITGLNTAFDTSLAYYVLSPNKRAPDLNTLLFETFQWNCEKEKEQADTQNQLHAISAQKLVYIRMLSDQLKAEVEQQSLQGVLYDIELPLVKILAKMEGQGISVDKAALSDFGAHLTENIRILEQEIYSLAGEEFNINSPQQLGIVLFERLELPGAKPTKRGYATGAEILEKLAPDYPVVERVLSYRTLAKLNSTYVEGLLPLIAEDGKIRAHFQQTVAATGRISCTEPNLQNIPVRQELGRQLRKAFAAESEEYILVGADYSQIELRVLAHMSQDETLIEGFNRGADVHRQTASRVFGIPESSVTDEMRGDAKAINFGIIYGMGSFRLANDLGITRAQADHYIREYFENHRGVERFMQERIAFGKEHGYVETLFGRKRPIPEINARAFAVRQQGERLAMNTPIQGSAADIIKMAMIKVDEALRRRCPNSALVLQIHDELIVQAHRDELETVKGVLHSSMKDAVELSVTLEVSLAEGENWYLLT